MLRHDALWDGGESVADRSGSGMAVDGNQVGDVEPAGGDRGFVGADCPDADSCSGDPFLHL